MSDPEWPLAAAGIVRTTKKGRKAVRSEKGLGMSEVYGDDISDGELETAIARLPILQGREAELIAAAQQAEQRAAELQHRLNTWYERACPACRQMVCDLVGIPRLPPREQK